MALQQFVCVLTVTILLLCTGCDTAPGKARIAGGQLLPLDSPLWHASFDSGGKHRCGGSLINDIWVITAAHCVTGLGSDVKVYLGRFNLSGSNPNEVSRTISQVKCHPSYNNLTNDNDICLVKLSSPVNFTNSIRPVCLTNSTVYSGSSMYVAGWDKTPTNGSNPFNSLQVASVQKVGKKECQCNTSVRITDKKICAKALVGKIDSCQGDLGGILVVFTGAEAVAVGIVNFVDDCSKSKVVGVYTRVAAYKEWIINSISSNKPCFLNVSSTGVDKDANFTCPTSAPPTASSTQTVFTNHTSSSTMPVKSTHPHNSSSTMPVKSTHPHTRPSTMPVKSTHPHTSPPTTNHPTTDDKSIFCGGENLIHFTHFTSLWVLALSLYVLVGHA